MDNRNRLRRLLLAGVIVVLVSAACSRDPVAPSLGNRQVSRSVAPALSPLPGQSRVRRHVFEGRSGEVYQLDERARTLTVRDGRTVRLPSVLSERVGDLLGGLERLDAKLARFERDANYRHFRGQIESRSDGARRRTRVRTGRGSHVSIPRLGAANYSAYSGRMRAPMRSPSLLENDELPIPAEAVCRDISETIYNTQQELDNLHYEIDRLLWAIVRAQNLSDPASPNYLQGLATLLAQLDMLKLQEVGLLLQLNVLAAMWNLNDCWNWQTTPNPGGSDGWDDSDPDEGCTQEWAEIEASNDDGATWYTWWEGYVTVCPEN